MTATMSRGQFLRRVGVVAAVAVIPVAVTKKAPAVVSITNTSFHEGHGGGQDDSEYLQRLVDDAYRKGTKCVIPPGHYKLSRPLLLRGETHIYNTTLEGPAQGPALELRSGHHSWHHS